MKKLLTCKHLAYTVISASKIKVEGQTDRSLSHGPQKGHEDDQKAEAPLI